MIYRIYGLFSTENGVVRYIGQTKSPLKQRKNEHKCDALTRKFHNHKCHWIRSVYNKGFEIDICELEICDENNWEEREIFWISNLKEKNNLVNELSGGQSGGLGGKVKDYYDYDEAKKYMKMYAPEIKSRNEYKKFYENNLRILKDKLPKAPQKVYNYRHSWKGWADFLGTENKSSKELSKQFLTYEKAMEFVRNNGIQSSREYLEFKQTYQQLPRKPEKTYEKEWKNWNVFLNKEPILIENYGEFLNYMKKEYPEITGSGTYRKFYEKNKPTNIPCHPDRKYSVKWSDITKDLRK